MSGQWCPVWMIWGRLESQYWLWSSSISRMFPAKCVGGVSVVSSQDYPPASSYLESGGWAKVLRVSLLFKQTSTVSLNLLYLNSSTINNIRNGSRVYIIAQIYLEISWIRALKDKGEGNNQSGM